MQPKMTPKDCAQMLMEAERVVALTGAGISTSAGVPDFRGPNGLYVTRRYDPETVFDIDAFLAEPQPFYDFTRDFLSVVDDIEPTVAHRFLATMESEGRLRCVVTQNIDFLHQRAGSENVISVHGGYWTSRCLRCGLVIDFETLRSLIEEERAPRCGQNCGGLIKPDIVFFGEAVQGMDQAADEVLEADLMLVLGSSLTVYPVASLPGLARCPVIVVNKGPVGLAPGPGRFFVDEDLDRFFEEVGCLLK
jgi:NAD-dependent deacetylase